MPHFTKPAEGSWTEHYPELGTEPVSYADSISPEFYELEREAIFGRTWLNVGRRRAAPEGRAATSRRSSTAPARRSSSCAAWTARCARSTTSAATAATSSCGPTTRARRRAAPAGSSPASTTAGATRSKASCTFVQQEQEFFDLDKADYPLASVQCDVWEGFIFVNLDPSNTTPLREYLGELGKGLEGYPFHELTQVHKYRAEIGEQLEALHRRVRRVLPRTGPAREASGLRRVGEGCRSYGYEALAYGIDGPHGMVSSWGGMSPPKDLEHGEADRARAAQRPVRSVGRARHRARRAAARAQPGAATRRGASTRSCSSRTSWC